ncbi:MAG: RNA polymerase sigma-70 factor ECF subfamily [Puniceicoccaceae bacterium 5H]|nr:MAG: RNA polymerase sigma-70 factor ECF subfamily [Puniceicoccaceae bacterium 5H]
MATETPDSQTHDADAALMLEVRAGDERALEQLIERWKGPLINFFYRSLQNMEQAEDLAQLTFIRLYRAAGKYEPRAKFSTYLFYIARRLLINEFRRRQRKPLEAVDPSELHAVDRGDEDRNISEIEEAFEQALERLPEKQRTAILLLKQQELSYAEIADVMDATESAVKTWIFRARQTLKQELKDLV